MVVGSTVSVLTKKNQRSDGSSISPDTLTLGKEGTTTVIGSDTFNVANIGGVNNRLSIAGNINVSVGAATTTFRYTSTTNAFTNPRIAYGGGRFVIAGEFGKVMYSNDGTTWTLATTAFPNVKPHSLAYGSGIFMIVTDEDPSKVYTSNDGNTWNQITYTGTMYSVFSIAYGNNYFIGVRPNNNIEHLMVSNSTGSAWLNIKFTGTDAGFSGVCFGTMSSGANPYVFLIFGKNIVRRIATNSSVAQATLATEASWSGSTITGNWYYGAFGNDVFMLASTDNKLAISLDAGITWSVTLFNPSLYGILYVNNEWYLASSSGILVSRNNGTTWTLRNSPTVEYFASNGTTVVGINGNTQYGFRITNKRVDGTALTTDTITIGQEGTTTVVGSETISMGTTNTLTIGGTIAMNKILSSSLSFKQSTLPFSLGASRYGIYAQNIFVVLEDVNTNSGRIITSTDGLTYTSSSGVGASMVRGLAYGMINGTGTFMVATYTTPSRIWKSTNGTSWTEETGWTNTLDTIHAIAYGDGVFVVCTAYTANNIATTTDGKVWSNIQARGTGSYSIVFGAISNGTNVFLVIGSNGLYRSTDKGVTWNVTAIALPSGTWERPAFGNDVFILLSTTTKAITRSTDGGLTWSTPTVFNLTIHNATFIENTWYIGTDNGYVLISNDNGITWESKYTGVNISLFLYGGSKVVGFYKDTQSLITIKKVNTDGTNMTADVLTLGQTGTTTRLGAPLTVAYPPSMITNNTQVGYVYIGTIPAAGALINSNTTVSTISSIPRGIWLFSWSIQCNGTPVNYFTSTIAVTGTIAGTGGSGTPVTPMVGLTNYYLIHGSCISNIVSATGDATLAISLSSAGANMTNWGGYFNAVRIA